MRRDHWIRQISRLDPDTEYHEIYGISSSYEFPWDTMQALGFALYRTYAVPSIGQLLGQTGEFTERAQKRYDDTVLILDAVGEHGPDVGEGREAVRRMNRMHGAYDISNDDYRYVLSTFVVVPKRWMGAYAWRPYSPREVRAATNYYRDLGRRMNIKDIPETYEEFERLMDDYERRHFAYDPGGHAVSEATLDLMASWYPGPLGTAARRASVCLMDPPLRAAFGYKDPNPTVERVVRGGLRMRGRFVRLLPARGTPQHGRDSSTVRGYPNGYRIADLGTFPGRRPAEEPRHSHG
ncbi:oxygenase MpaB family protein [Streptomyces sp. NBC_00356]|uniref:oxygenase MpaB family protein n=1 Tax=Streptomyces sp. NBC_00356 TaxID=2975724 RepID=UPI002E270949